MRQLLALTLAGVFLSLWAATAQADGQPRKRPRLVRKPAAPSANDELLELIRQTRQAAEAARDEARRAHEQIADYGLRIAELKNEIARLQTEIGVIAKSTTTENHKPENPQSVVAVSTNPQSPIPNPQSEERLAKLEEQVEVNTAQIREQAQTKVESDSRFRVRLSGMILANTYLNSDDSSFNDVPTFAVPASARAGQRRNNLGGTLRQTQIGFQLTGPRVGNARLSAGASFDFWGGSIITRTDGDILGMLRIRTASMRLDWDRGAIEIGQTAPLISPLSPTSLAAVWFPAMTGAGNLWQWRAQITGERRLRMKEGSDLIFQGALIPTFGETVGGAVAEGPPAFEGHIAWRHALSSDHQIEIGLGGRTGRKSFTAGRKVDGYIVSGDWRIPLGSRIELSGEAYHGRAVSLSEEGGLRIDRVYALTGLLSDPATRISGIRSSGGWMQLALQARRDLEFNLAYGQDDPSNRDIRLGTIGNFTRFKNQTGSANFIYRLRPNFLISLEYRRLLTDYAAGRRTNNHYNLAFGYLF